MFLSKKVSSEKIISFVKNNYLTDLTNLANKKDTKKFFQKFRDHLQIIVGGEHKFTYNELGESISKKLKNDNYVSEKSIMFVDIPSFVYQKNYTEEVKYAEYISLFDILSQKIIKNMTEDERFIMGEKIFVDDIKNIKASGSPVLNQIKEEVIKAEDGLAKVEDIVYNKTCELVEEFKSINYAIEICKSLGYSKDIIDNLTHRLTTNTDYERYLESYPKKHISMTDLKNYSHMNKLKLGKYLDSYTQRNNCDREDGKKQLLKVGWSEDFISDL